MRYFVIGVIIGLIAMYFLRPTVPYSHIYINKTDTIVKDSVIYKDSIINKVKYLTSVDTFKMYLKDTVFIEKVIEDLTKYNTTYKYSDTLKNDSVAYIKLIEDVTRNQIKNRTLIYKNKVKPYIINEKALFLDLTTSYVGLSLDMNYPVDFLGGWDYRSRGIYFGVRYRIGGK